MKEKKKRKFYLSEKIWYLILSLIWLTGFVFAILGVIAYNVGDRLADNPLYQAEKGFAHAFKRPEGTVWDFRFFGTIVMVVSMVIFLIVIFYFSAKSNREEQAARRKAERKKILMESMTGTEPSALKEAEVKETVKPERK